MLPRAPDAFNAPNHTRRAGFASAIEKLVVVLSQREFNERTGIVIGLPMTTATYNETNPFAVKFNGPRGVASYILGHQPKSAIS